MKEIIHLDVEVEIEYTTEPCNFCKNPKAKALKYAKELCGKNWSSNGAASARIISSKIKE